MEDSEFFCNDYDWELFFRVSNQVIPDILREAYKLKMPFCVTGGKAVDAHTAYPAYSQNYIGSPDWDIDSSDRDGIVSFIMDRITSEIPSIRLFTKTVSKDLLIGGEEVSYKGVQIGIVPPSTSVETFQTNFEIRKCSLPFVADVFQKAGFACEVIEGIPYIPATRLIIDLIRTIQDRKDSVRGAERMLPRYEYTEAKMASVSEEIEETVQNLKTKISKAIKKGKVDTIDYIIEEHTADIIDYAKEIGKLSVTPLQQEFTSVHKDFLHTIEKLQRTQQRLGEMSKLYGGSLKEICTECATNVESAIDGVSCKLINQQCTGAF
jgi:hypothetical protein